MTFIGKTIGALTVFNTLFWQFSVLTKPMPWSESDTGLFYFFAVFLSGMVVFLMYMSKLIKQ